MSEKMIGYILLLVGIGIILFSAFDVILVFTKSKEPIQFFSFSGLSIDFARFLPEELSQLNQMRGNTQMNQEIIPADMINVTSNIFIHLIFMGFFASVGMRIATIGTYLLRSIHVHLKEEKNS